MKKRLSVIITISLCVIMLLATLASCTGKPKDLANFNVDFILSNQNVGLINKETVKGLKEQKIKGKREYDVYNKQGELESVKTEEVVYFGYKLADVLINVVNENKEYKSVIKDKSSKIFVTPNVKHVSNFEQSIDELYFVYGYRGKNLTKNKDSLLPAREGVAIVNGKGNIIATAFNRLYVKTALETSLKEISIIQKKNTEESYDPAKRYVSFDDIMASINNGSLLLKTENIGTNENPVSIKNAAPMAIFLHKALGFPDLLKGQNKLEVIDFNNIITSTQVKIIKFNGQNVDDEILEIPSANVFANYYVSVDVDASRGTYKISIYDKSKLASEMLIASDFASIEIEEK